MSEIVKQIKDKGFPYYPEDVKWRNKMFDTMLSFDRTNLVDRQNKVIKDPKSGRKMRVDGYTANAIIKVYDALNNQNKKKFANVGLMKMQSIAFKFVK